MPGLIILSDSHSEYLFSKAELAKIPCNNFIEIYNENTKKPFKNLFQNTEIDFSMSCGAYLYLINLL